MTDDNQKRSETTLLKETHLHHATGHDRRTFPLEQLDEHSRWIFYHVESVPYQGCAPTKSVVPRPIGAVGSYELCKNLMELCGWLPSGAQIERVRNGAGERSPSKR